FHEFPYKPYNRKRSKYVCYHHLPYCPHSHCRYAKNAFSGSQKKHSSAVFADTVRGKNGNSETAEYRLYSFPCTDPLYRPDKKFPFQRFQKPIEKHKRKYNAQGSVNTFRR